MVSFRKPVAKAGVMRRKMLEVHLVENLTFKKTESEVRSLTHVSCDMSDMSDMSRGKVMSQGANKLQMPFLPNSIYSIVHFRR